MIDDIRVIGEVGMRKAPGSALALAAVFPAAMVPVLLPVLHQSGAADAVQGSIIGVLLGMALLLIALSVKSRAA